MLRTFPRFAAVLLATGCFIGIAGCRANGDSGTGGASGRGASGTGGGASGGSGGGSGSGSVSGGSGGVSGGSGGLSGGSGGVSGGSGGLSGGSGGNAGTPGETCDQAPTPRRPDGTIVTLPIETVYDGMPFVFGEPNHVAGGATVTTLNFRFYVSHVELIAAGGAAVPVDIVTTTGAPAPYGLFLYNADDPDAQTLRVLAPQGSYVGMKLALGMSAACNSGFAQGRSFPLSADSQMTWEHLMGYLFLRYEARVETTGDQPDGGAGSVPPPPTLIHMGGDIANLSTTSAVPVRIDGTLSVPASTTGTGGGSADHRLWVAMDQIFKGATTDVDLTGVPFATQADIAAGERLRRSGANLPLMVFRP